MVVLRRGLLGDFQFPGRRPLGGERPPGQVSGLSAGVSGFLPPIMGGRYALWGQEGQVPGRAPPLCSLEMLFPDTPLRPQPAEPPDQAQARAGPSLLL